MRIDLSPNDGLALLENFTENNRDWRLAERGVEDGTARFAVEIDGEDSFLELTLSNTGSWRMTADVTFS